MTPIMAKLKHFTGEGLNPSGQQINQVNNPSLAANVSCTTRQDFFTRDAQ